MKLSCCHYGLMNHQAGARSRLARAIVVLALCPLLLLYGTACSLFAGSRQNISVNSDPAGAKVVIAGMPVGNTPLQYQIRKNEEAMITVSKEGYDSATGVTSTSLSTLGILDIIGGCIFLLPFFGLLAPGAYEQEPNNFYFSLNQND